MKQLLYIMLFAFLSMSVNASDMTALPEAEVEMWCVDGFRVMYVEDPATNNFQVFQVLGNGKLAVKAIQCNGTEVRKIN